MIERRQIEKILYEGASGISDPAARRAFLEQTCREDSALLERLEELLEVRDAADDFFVLEDPVWDVRAPVLEEDAGAEAAETLGTLIGRYRLLRRLGEGGCGVVYLAEQEEPVRRRVALKIVRLGMDTADVIARFELERQALALMDHPNIARVLDAGATATGRPFFVMEVVEGEKITDFCNQGRLGIERRLELFIQVCQAIQHAHQKGVIHRDIKPSNVLVRIHDGIPVPKVIDFGIAKATAPRTGGDISFTARDQFIGTPAYMSPEQAEGNGGIDVDTRSDIYSLGALLYELLTGDPPFNSKRLREAGVDELRRILREEEPRKPSELMAAPDAAAARGSDPQRLQQLLRGDLDWIVLKALEKDRQRRYGTANGLAMDVQRYLGDEPVSARPPSRSYRLRKLMHRNKVVFVAGAAVLATLIGGLGTSTWLFFREKEALAEQSRLRVDAEVARTNEEALRRRAEAREVIARAAVQLRYGDIQQVDDVLAEIPVSLVSPSLESAATFRTLGEWHVLAGRWKQAGQRFASVSHAISAVDESDSDNASRDVLPAAAAICESGDVEAYEQFRKRIIHRFSGSSNPIVAEQVIKASLIVPADQGSVAALDPLGKKILDSMESGSGKDGGPYMAAWRAFSLALLEYRRGDFPAAEKWAGRCLDSPNDSPARSSSVRIVRAMARLRMHRTVEANGDASEARRVIQDYFNEKPNLGNGTAGFWFDWINARILLREIDGMGVPMADWLPGSGR